MPPQTRSSIKRTTPSSANKVGGPFTQAATAPQASHRTRSATTETKDVKPEPPHRKRARPKPKHEPVVVPLKRVRGKQGGLKGIMNMPVDVFAEITVHLYPVDLVLLARTTKFFRQMLMSRSFVRIWKSAEANVKGLPPCPKELCEPQYAALVFTKNCSVGLLPLKISYLSDVRHMRGRCAAIQPSARWIRYFKFDFASSAAINNLVPGKHPEGSAWCLYNEAKAIKQELNALEREGNKEKTERWSKARRAIVHKRNQDARPLAAFLESIDREHDDELSSIRAKRAAEVRSRLLKLGWETKDIEDNDFDWRKEWWSFVRIAKPLTERAWENILPTLVTHLELNRARRLERELKKRRHERRCKLSDWVYSITANLKPFAQALDVHHPQELNLEGGSTAAELQSMLYRRQPRNPRALRMAFPSYDEIMGWPAIKALEEPDVAPGDFDQVLQESKQMLDELVLEWTKDLEQTLICLLPEEPATSEEEHALSAGDTLAGPIPEYALMFGTGSNMQPITSLPAGTQRLLRADSAFMRRNLVQFYPDDFHLLEVGGTSPIYRTQVAKVAKALLALLGLPDATYLQLQAAGQIFICGRCEKGNFLAWRQLIGHYVDEEKAYASVQQNPRVRSSLVKYAFMHDADVVMPDKPLLRMATKEERAKLTASFGGTEGPFRQCLLCNSIGMSYYHNEARLLAHIRNVSEPYDPYLPRGGSSANPSGEPGRPAGNTKTAAIQQQIDDTVGIMRENITRVAERGERLDVLQDKTDNLAVNAQGFRRGANRVRKNMWWKDMKMRIIIGVGIAILIVIIVVPIVKAVQNK
ncbi:hypothetical protein FRC06_009421 [Ceratobasidium sp. 370]|nr:hypothetical protein FRC06_009421 [Ceratobasidium sp. 370]